MQVVSKLKVFWILAALLVGGMGNLSCSRQDSTGNAVLATVNHEPVTVPEFRFFMNQHMAEAYGYFLKKYDARDHENFWNTRYGSEIPIEIVKKMTLKTCISVKIQQILAKEKGILEDVAFDSFLKDLRSENARRKQAVENHKIIYGPIEYTLQTYMNRRMSLMTIRLKDMLFQIQDAGRIRTETIDSLYQDMIDQMIQNARIVVNPSAYRLIEVRWVKGMPVHQP